MRKTRFKHKRKKNKSKKKIKGGGDLSSACHKYMHPELCHNIPLAQSEETDDMYEAYYKNTYETILSIDESTNTNFLILKIGSNDSEESKKEGSKGLNGELFWETYPLPSGRKVTTLIDMKESKNLARIIYRLIPDGVKLIAISPLSEYTNFEYPFINNKTSNWINELTETFDDAHNFQNNKTYIQSYFPIGINQNVDSYNYKILNYLSTRPGPLLLFNAMGSWCYSSIKYILDSRYKNGINTSYAGLVDTINPPDVSCEIGIPIYPIPREICSSEKPTSEEPAVKDD